MWLNDTFDFDWDIFIKLQRQTKKKKQQQNPYTWIVELISEMEREQEGENI